MQLHRVRWEDVNWEKLDRYPDRTIYQTREWLQFVAATQNASPVVAALVDGEHIRGFFTGLVIRKFRFRILGSPFPGWTTSYMGFNLEPGVCRIEAARLLRSFAFEELGCVHLEMSDRRLPMDAAKSLGFGIREARGFEVDLSQPEDRIFANMSSSCRRCIRKAEKLGVTVHSVRNVDDARSFATEYYDQLEDVFAKQSLVPTYSRTRVVQLIEHVFPAGRLLLLRALDPDGSCIATGIFPAFNDTMYFWGGASWRNGQHFRPNEAIQWYAMRHWKASGITRYDMSGKGEYKRKYGGEDICVPSVRTSRVSGIEPLRNAAKSAFRLRQQLLGALR